ncbi:MAG: glutamate 5-kinase [Planctomycetaceae bacterium]|nr:glutamate 5-kinase [Planctomycetaceae bacterium]
MQNLVRQEVIAAARTLVVKIGTNVLSCDDDSLNRDRIAALCEQIDRVRKTGRRVVVVSSGAVGAGIGLLKLPGRPTDLPHLQAAAAAGQAHLIRLYDEALRGHGYHAAQILCTGNDFKQRSRYLNIRNTLNTLFEYDAVPIVNENDTVSVQEIRFGDNDRLAALVTTLLNDPLLIILSVIEGLYDGDPSKPDSRVISQVDEWSDDLFQVAADIRSKRGTGGMQSKLEAIKTATAVGENVILANGTSPTVLDDVLAGCEVGTLFLAGGRTLPAWKRWIGYSVPSAGRIHIDDGARRAVCERGTSLLAIGMTSVDGDFEKGAIVTLVASDGTELARGLTNFGSRDAATIAGKQSHEIESLLGDLPYSEVIHRDNLVVTHTR